MFLACECRQKIINADMSMRDVVKRHDLKSSMKSMQNTNPSQGEGFDGIYNGKEAEVGHGGGCVHIAHTPPRPTARCVHIYIYTYICLRISFPYVFIHINDNHNFQLVPMTVSVISSQIIKYGLSSISTTEALDGSALKNGTRLREDPPQDTAEMIPRQDPQPPKFRSPTGFL